MTLRIFTCDYFPFANLAYLRIGNGNPLQYSCLENPMDRGAWQAAVHGVSRVRHDWVACTFLRVMASTSFICDDTEHLFMGFPGGSDGKESTCNAGDPGSIPVLGRSPGEGNWLPTPVFLTEESHGQRSLVGCSPWDHKELDTTEQLTRSCAYWT